MAVNNLEPEAAAARGAEPDARIAGRQRRLVVAHRAGRTPARARSGPGGRHELSRPRAPLVPRVVNSRIRLLLLCYPARLRCAARACELDRDRARLVALTAGADPDESDRRPAAGRGTIFDSVGTPLALGEQATTVFADPRQVLHPQKEANVAARVLGLKANAVYKQLKDRSLGFRLRRAEGRSRPRRETRQAEALRVRLLRRGAPHVSAALGGGAGARVRGRRQHRHLGPRARARQVASGDAGPADSRSRSVRARDQRRAHRAGAARQGSVSHPRSEVSRRTPSRSCGGRSRSGERRAPPQSSSIRRRERCSRWQKRRRTTRTSSRPLRRSSSAITQ